MKEKVLTRLNHHWYHLCETLTDDCFGFDHGLDGRPTDDYSSSYFFIMRFTMLEGKRWDSIKTGQSWMSPVNGICAHSITVKRIFIPEASKC